MKKYILGIETSCDDTALAIVELNGKLIGDEKISSAKIQAQYGGVVPEIAARKHAENILPLLIKLLNKYQISLNELAIVAYSKNPGLKGCLMVGNVFAHALADHLNIPTMSMNHIYGHIFSIGLTNNIKFPYLALVASGKTTSIFFVKNFVDVQLLNHTLDDAIGEVYDKVGRVMGFEYPAGPAIDKLADENITPLLICQQPQASKNFSYSGFKTASISLWKKINEDQNQTLLEKQKVFATSFQTWIIRSVVNKINYYADLYNVKNLAIVGGVASNSWMRKELSKLKYYTMLVDLKYATDNGAMIAYYASQIYKKWNFDNE